MNLPPIFLVPVLVSFLCFLTPAEAADAKTIPCANVSSPIDWNAACEPGSLLAVIDHIEGIDHPVRIICQALEPTGKPDCRPYEEEKGDIRGIMLVKYKIWFWKNGCWEQSALPTLLARLPRQEHSFHAVYESSETREKLSFLPSTGETVPGDGEVVHMEFVGMPGYILRALSPAH